MKQPHKLLIIEDSEYHWKMVQQTMRKFVEVYPDNKTDFDNLKELFTLFATKESNEANFKALKQMIDDENCTIALVDVNLLDNKDNNKTGMSIKQRILDVSPQPMPVRMFTSYAEGSGDLSGALYIRKFINGEYNMPQVVREKVLPWLAGELKQDIKDLQKTFDEAVSLKKPVWKLGLRLKPLLHALISILFYCCFIGVFLGGMWLFVSKLIEKSHDDKLDLILLAEYSFLTFLPFTISLSFFVFYQKALKRFVVGENDRDDTPLEGASRLMRLSKKLFISTLVSYLFIKFIEVIAPEEQSNRPVDIAQVCSIAGCVIILLLYIVYLDKHKD